MFGRLRDANIYGDPSWWVGVLQINATVPSSLTGSQALVVAIGGVQSAPALLNVTH